MTKDTVLSILAGSNDFVSGEYMSEVIGVSRMAVSSAVKALRQDGYDITSQTNKGYRLNSSPDAMTKGEFMARLGKERCESIFCFDTVDSTNRKIRELAISGACAGTVVTADEQTGGRGRLGRTFESPKGKGIYLSMLMRPDCTPSDTAAITAWAAVAAHRAILSACGEDADIKWVNDLLIGGRKICGILTEMSVESESGHVDYVIVGIGINVNHAENDFPKELRDKAGSLFMHTKKKQKRADIAAALIRELDMVRTSFPLKKDEYLEYYRAHCDTIGRTVTASDEPERKAAAEAVNDDFSIRLRYLDGGRKDLSSGEISVILV